MPLSDSDQTSASVIINLALYPFALLFHGWALTKLWLWFVVPQFGLAPLRVSRAVGLALIIGIIVTRIDLITKKDSFPGELQMTSAFFTGFLLLTGLVVHTLWP